MKKLILSQAEKKVVDLDITDTKHYCETDEGGKDLWVSWYTGYCVVSLGTSVSLAFRWVAAGGKTEATKDDYEVSLDEVNLAAEIKGGTLMDGDEDVLSPITTRMVEYILDGVAWEDEVLEEIEARVEARKKYEK